MYHDIGINCNHEMTKGHPDGVLSMRKAITAHPKCVLKQTYFKPNRQDFWHPEKGWPIKVETSYQKRRIFSPPGLITTGAFGISTTGTTRSAGYLEEVHGWLQTSLSPGFTTSRLCFEVPGLGRGDPARFLSASPGSGV